MQVHFFDMILLCANSFRVADLSVMLALMVGRNVRETMQIVDQGRVKQSLFYLEHLLTGLPSGQISAGPLSSSVVRNLALLLFLRDVLRASSVSGEFHKPLSVVLLPLGLPIAFTLITLKANQIQTGIMRYVRNLDCRHYDVLIYINSLRRVT